MPLDGPTLTSTQNPHVKYARSLHVRKHRQQERAFIVEGKRLFLDAIDAGAVPSRVFVDLERADTEELETLANLAARCVAIHPSSEAVIDAVSDTRTPQGIVAVFPFSQLPKPQEVANPLFVVADGLKDPGNLGTLMRSAQAAGASGIFTSPRTVDPFSPKVVRAGMGAHFRLPLHDLDWNDPPPHIVKCRNKVIAEALGSVSYDELDWAPSTVLVIGGETSGISPDARDFAKSSVFVPLMGQVESLNAAIAGAVILFEAARQRRTQ